MYKKFTSQSSYDFISRAINKISLENEFVSREEGFWVCYGSFVLNLQSEKSDLDLLYVHSGTNPVSRIGSDFEKHPVTIYSLSKDDFIDDGSQKRFGGYFSGKVLNPYIVISEKEDDADLVLRVAGEFIADFAAAIGGQRRSKPSTPANLVADTVLARFQLCPWYSNYFMRYYTYPNFSGLWKRMEEVIPLSLIAAKKVASNKNGFIYIDPPGKNSVHVDFVKSIAKFWSIGSHLHNSPHFLDTYIQKSKQYCSNRKALKQMILFVKEKAQLVNK